MSKDNNLVTQRKDSDNKIKYVVKGTDGWNLVTNSKAVAEKEAQGSRKFGSNRVHY